MKRIYLVFLLLVLLVSCSNFPSLNPTNTPQPTFTSTLTFTPSVTPTITLTPTETPDPNMPPDATGKDSVTGEYTKSVDENGKIVVYVWKQFLFGDDSKNGVTGHWFKSWMANGPINLTEPDDICPDHWDIWGEPITPTFRIDMSVYAIDNQTDLDKIGYIFHPDRKSEWEKIGGPPCGGRLLPYTIMTDLFLRYIGLLPIESGISAWDSYESQRDYYYPNGGTDDEKKHWAEDHKSFAETLNDGNMAIQIGNDDWIPQKGYEVYWVNEDMVMNDPTFQVNISASVVKSYYLKVIVKDGKLIAFIAPGKGWLKGQLIRDRDKRERIFNTMILFPLEAAIRSTYPINNASFLPFQEYQGHAGVFSGVRDWKPYKVNTPFIDFTDN